MKERILKIMLWMLVSIIIIAVGILAYLKIVDIETKIPNEKEYSCNIQKDNIEGRNIFTITPKNVAKSDLKILYFHGGAYMAEAGREHWKFVEKVVNDTGATVIFPDYPLTPKYTYKDVFNMVIPLYKDIIEKVDTNNLILMGDSAGAGISLALAEKMSEEQVDLPSKIILISPWLDVRLTNPEIDEVQKYDKNLNKEGLKLAGVSYAGEDGINNYLVNPIDGNVSRLKNITILTGTYDILNPDVHIFEEKAKKQGTEIEVKEYDKTQHDWIIENQEEKAYDDLLEVIKR